MTETRILLPAIALVALRAPLTLFALSNALLGVLWVKLARGLF